MAETSVSNSSPHVEQVGFPNLEKFTLSIGSVSGMPHSFPQFPNLRNPVEIQTAPLPGRREPRSPIESGVY